jgi:hypothetical protein
VQEVSLDKGGTEPVMVVHFSMGNGNASYCLGTTCFIHKEIISS